MPITLPAVPTFTDPDLGAGDNARAEAWSMLNAKYHDAGEWAAWAAGVMNLALVEINTSLGSDTVDADIDALNTEIGNIPTFVPGTISGAGDGFTDSLLTALKNRLSNDIATASTGLGSAEAAMFARQTARVQAAVAKAYEEATTLFSSKGWDVPPGALASKQTEMSAESAQNLTDSSGKILEESAKLAVQYNLGIINASTQLIEALGRVYDSEESRKFEASKATAMLAAEAYTTTLGLTSTKANIVLKKGDMALAAKARQLSLEVTTLSGLAQGFQQMVASAMNGVNSSASFGFSGSQAQVLNTTE